MDEQRRTLKGPPAYLAALPDVTRDKLKAFLGPALSSPLLEKAARRPVATVRLPHSMIEPPIEKHDEADPYWILFRSGSTPRQRRKAAVAIADAEVPHAQATTQKGWLHKLFVKSILDAARDRHRVQRIRDGKGWIRDRSRRPIRMRPDSTLRFFRWWLPMQARALARAKTDEPQLRHLSADQRELIQLAQAEYVYSEVAEKMGRTPEAVRNLALRGKRKKRS